MSTNRAGEVGAGKMDSADRILLGMLHALLTEGQAAAAAGLSPVGGSGLIRWRVK